MRLAGIDVAHCSIETFGDDLLQGGDHVLSKIPARERELLDISVQVAADAVQLIVAEGLDAAMRNINAR